MPANATHAPMEPRSLWVIAAQSAASHQNLEPAVPRCGIVIGAIRMSAPLPADRADAFHHGRPACIPATNCRTEWPMPKITRDANACANVCGISRPQSMRCSRVQNAS